MEATTYKTDQEAFWAGEFGTDYIPRNDNKALLASNIHFFSKALQAVQPLNSALELGANIGLNLRALRHLFPKIKLGAVEINEQAVQVLKELDGVNVTHQSITDFKPERHYDLVLSKGVLIHINPEKLKQAYQCLYESSRRYICIGEYYNPSPVAIPYRGHSDKLFKRDFAGELMDLYPDLELVDYGFAYHRDKFSQDDITWFLLEKK